MAVSSALLAMAESGSISKHRLKTNGGKFITWRDGKRFLYVLLAEFYVEGGQTRYRANLVVGE